MPAITVGNQGLIPRGTFREHFTFHSWQAEMDCQTAFEREADSQTRLAPQQVMRLMIRWSRMPNWSSNASRATGRPGRNLCVAIPGASLTSATGSPETEDLSQDVFLRVYRTLGSYRSAHGGFATWMTSVTRNLLIDHYRRTKRDRVTDSLDDAMPVVENKESVGRRPDEQALLGELSGQVQSALTRLSPELREAVILRDLQQLEYVEIQRVLAVPEGTVKSRINRGRIELARILQQMGVRPS